MGKAESMIGGLAVVALLGGTWYLIIKQVRGKPSKEPEHEELIEVPTEVTWTEEGQVIVDDVPITVDGKPVYDVPITDPETGETIYVDPGVAAEFRIYTGERRKPRRDYIEPDIPDVDPSLPIGEREVDGLLVDPGIAAEFAKMQAEEKARRAAMEARIR